MTYRKLQLLPSFVNCVRIDRNSNSRQSVLPHTHKNELELFYVYAGDNFRHHLKSENSYFIGFPHNTHLFLIMRSMQN